MAGFFGLFNYAKEGPGIEKDAPQKKTFIVFFETFFRNFWKFIPINLVFCLLSFPIITNGLASAGLTNVVRNIARDKHSFGLSDFWETIRKNWKQALPSGIINFFVYLVLIFDVWFFYTTMNGIMSAVAMGLCIFFLFVFTVMNYYISTMIITFRFKLSQIYKNSFKFVFLNFKNNILCFICTTLVYALFFVVAYFWGNATVSMVEFILLVCCVPAFVFLMTQYFIFPSIKKYIIDPYYLEHPNDDIDERRNLGIEIENTEQNDETEESETTSLPDTAADND